MSVFVVLAVERLVADGTAPFRFFVMNGALMRQQV